MNYDEIKTFIAVFEAGSITKGAQALYIEQGSASKRIHQLEEELGVQLFYRKKGVRTIELTPEGKMFLPIAQQVSALMDDSKKLKQMSVYQELKVASTSSINQFFLLQHYKAFMRNYPNIELKTQIEHSKEIYQLIEAQTMNLGFVTSLHRNYNIVSTPLFQEKYVILFHKDSLYAKTKNLRDLRSEHEIYLKWSTEFALWHKNAFPYASRKKITLGALSSVFDFLDNENDWVIITQKLANIWIEEYAEWECSTIANEPPKRIVSMIHHRYPKPGVKQNIQFFLDDFTKILNDDDTIELLI